MRHPLRRRTLRAPFPKIAAAAFVPFLAWSVAARSALGAGEGLSSGRWLIGEGYLPVDTLTH